MRRSKERTNQLYLLSSYDKILSSLIEKAWYTCTFLNDFRETNQQ